MVKIVADFEQEETALRNKMPESVKEMLEGKKLLAFQYFTWQKVSLSLEGNSTQNFHERIAHSWNHRRPAAQQFRA